VLADSHRGSPCMSGEPMLALDNHQDRQGEVKHASSQGYAAHLLGHKHIHGMTTLG